MTKYKVKVRFRDQKAGLTRSFDTFIDAAYQADVIPIAERLYGKGCVMYFAKA